MVKRLRCGSCEEVFEITNKRSNMHTCPECNAINVIEKEREQDSSEIPIADSHLQYKEFYCVDSYVETSMIFRELESLDDEALVEEIKHILPMVQYSKSVDAAIQSFDSYGGLFDPLRALLEASYVLHYSTCVMEE